MLPSGGGQPCPPGLCVMQSKRGHGRACRAGEEQIPRVLTLPRGRWLPELRTFLPEFNDAGQQEVRPSALTGLELLPP